MLHDVNANVMSLTQSFIKFTSSFHAYYPPLQGGSGQ
jgi:hypothetical protein